MTSDATDERPNQRPTEVTELPELPSPSSIYTAALARAARAAVLSGVTGGVAGLPRVALRVRGVRLDRERLDAYRRLVGENLGGEVAPPGFVHVTCFGLQLALMARPDFPLPMLGLVHVANRVEQLRGITPADSLEVTTWARNLTSRLLRDDRVGTEVELVTEVRTDQGELLWQGVSTYLAKSVTLRHLPMAPRATHEEFVPPVPTSGWSTAVASTREYARVSDDRNPIHTNGLAARAFGFPGRIAHGMDTAARALAALGRERGEAFTWRVDFAAPALVPGRVALRVARHTPTPDPVGGAREGWTMTAWDPRRGRLHLTGTLEHA